MYSVYVIQCVEDKYYVGYTKNIKHRLEQHNSGDSRWTSQYKNWKLVYMENYQNKTDALKREKFLKKQKNGDVFKKIIAAG